MFQVAFDPVLEQLLQKALGDLFHGRILPTNGGRVNPSP
jgi:hypothetical protein